MDLRMYKVLKSNWFGAVKREKDRRHGLYDVCLTCYLSVCALTYQKSGGECVFAIHLVRTCRLDNIREKAELLFFDALDMQNYRSSKDFPDMHALIMHTYSSDNADVRVDHLGLHKALCILMRWNYSMPPDNSKAYQFLPADEAQANQDDLIMWPPMVIIHNTITGRSKDGRMEGLGNQAMDSKMRDLGSVGGKSKSLHGRDGHLGITLVKFGGDQSGLKEAIRMAEYFEKDNHGRKAWGCLQPVTLGKDDDKNPSLVKVDRSGEKTRILYGYLATAADLCKVDFETRKKVVIESLREYEASK
ncbi:hypothetical protein POTOM_031928 [Populus tomentosa]|uniref:XS domain-containing protein n=1 Tax=Populus tomentosa TaxID=118781 RepID=A0A8X7Z799_POPTO|nr:hypothetical protein POTOM_031928 [Populus tomentosa]